MLLLTVITLFFVEIEIAIRFHVLVYFLKVVNGYSIFWNTMVIFWRSTFMSPVSIQQALKEPLNITSVWLSVHSAHRSLSGSRVRVGPLQSLVVIPVSIGGTARTMLACCKKWLKGTNSSQSYQHVNHIQTNMFHRSFILCIIYIFKCVFGTV